MQQETDDKGDENLGEASTKLQRSETNNMETENPTAALTISQSGKINNEVENHAETSSKGQSSQKGTPKSLRAKAKAIKKSSASNSMKVKKAKGTQNIQGKNRKKKKKGILQGNKESKENEHDRANNLNSSGKTVSNEEHIEKKQEREKNHGRIVGSNKGQKNQNSEEKHGGSDKNLRNQKNKEKIEEKHGGSDKNASNEKNKEKLDAKEKIKRDEKKKEKLGGLIFMCSAKTKPDCFHYRVMGVTMNKKELILGVKPGLKLFLYDFDLKLMYGIYEASSPGGVKLEPKAFGGAFPVQVRFVVHKDCFPVAESIFKKAIKDNYNEKNKFKTELTVRQVRKLSALFHPAAFQPAQPAAVPVRSPPRAIIWDRELYDGARELRAHSGREVFARGNHDGQSYTVLSDERDRRVDYRKVGFTNRDEIPRDLFMSEREYRIYGLQGERRNLTPPRHISSTLDPYQKDQEREHLLRQSDPVYRDTVPSQREAVLVDPLYLNNRALQSYNPIGRQDLPPATTSITAAASSSALAALDPYARDPYYTYRYGASSLDAYLPPPRRDEVSSGSYYVDSRRYSYLYETDPLRRRDSDQVDKLCSTYAADALSNYNQAAYYHGAKPETAPSPVSSRYSFAGPSISHR